MPDSSKDLSPVLRLTAEGRILAGFLSDASSAGVAEFNTAPREVQDQVKAKFGTPACQRENEIKLSVFRPVAEDDVIEMIRQVASHCGGPPGLHNLVGFEWVRISTILAGHYVAAPMPSPGRSPESTANTLEVAQYCLVGGLVRSSDLVLVNGDIITPEILQLVPKNIVFGPQQLNVEYSVGRSLSPVTVLVLDHRAIAVTHQERLVALAEAGIDEALCLVAYGYGVEVLKTMPTIEGSLLTSGDPPRIIDFNNEHVMVRIPVPTPRTLVRFSQTVVDLTLPH